MNQISIVDEIQRAQFEAEITGILEKRHPRKHALLQNFASKSQTFVSLRKDILDHYYFEQRQLSPLFAVDALASLIDRMMTIMQQDLHPRQAA